MDTRIAMALEKFIKGVSGDQPSRATQNEQKGRTCLGWEKTTQEAWPDAGTEHRLAAR